MLISQAQVGVKQIPFESQVKAIAEFEECYPDIVVIPPSIPSEVIENAHEKQEPLVLHSGLNEVGGCGVLLAHVHQTLGIAQLQEDLCVAGGIV